MSGFYVRSRNQPLLQRVWDTCVTRQTSSSLHALPFLSADAEEDAVSTLRTLFACPESQCSFSVSGTSIIYPSSPASCCNKAPGLSKPIYNRITPHSSSALMQLLVHSPRDSESWRFPVHATWWKVCSLPTASKRDSKKPNDNEVPGFLLQV